MSELTQQSCEACRADAPQVADEQMPELLAQVPEWMLVDSDGVKQLQRLYSFENFDRALAFTNEVGALAEEQGHHPALLTEWGKVTVNWWSHKIKGLHKNDFIMAAKTDQLYLGG